MWQSSCLADDRIPPYTLNGVEQLGIKIIDQWDSKIIMALAGLGSNLLPYDHKSGASTVQQLCYPYVSIYESESFEDLVLYHGKQHSKLKFTMFWALSQNYQHFLEKVIKQIVWETQKSHLNFSRPSSLSYWSKQYFAFFGLLKFLMTFFEFLRQLLQHGYVTFYIKILNDSFEIRHKTCSFLKI